MTHYYDKKQDSEFRPYKVTVQVKGRSLDVWSASGIFSKDKLDMGTKLLIECMEPEKDWRVHDLGCGNGVVGIFVKLCEPSCEVVCSDVSQRAIQLTTMNAKDHDVKLNVIESDGYEMIEGTFDLVLFNPPYVAGRQTIYRLIDEAAAHLSKGGLLQLVARHNKGGETLKKRMIEVFGNCTDDDRASGYRVYTSKK